MPLDDKRVRGRCRCPRGVACHLSRRRRGDGHPTRRPRLSLHRPTHGGRPIPGHCQRPRDARSCHLQRMRDDDRPVKRPHSAQRSHGREDRPVPECYRHPRDARFCRLPQKRDDDHPVKTPHHKRPLRDPERRAGWLQAGATAAAALAAREILVACSPWSGARLPRRCGAAAQSAPRAAPPEASLKRAGHSAARRRGNHTTSPDSTNTGTRPRGAAPESGGRVAALPLTAAEFVLADR